MAERHTSQAREKAMFRYTSALERGDFEVVSEVLAQAETDPILAQMIREVDDVAAQELEQNWKTANIPDRRSWRDYARSWVGIAATVVLVAFVAIMILTLMGPSIGNVFSSTVSGLPNRTPPPHIAALKPTPTAMVMAMPPAMQPTGAGLPVQLPPGAPTPAATATAAPAEIRGTEVPSTQAPSIPTAQQMIVKNGEIDLLVENTDAAIDQVTQIAADNGGYVLSTQASYQGDVKIATITIGVRVDQYETALRRLRQIAIKVEREISTGQDVSSEYVDLQSRLKNLEATRDRVSALLAQAKTVAEAMQINQQLSDIEGQIEQIKGRMTYLSGRAAYSTITINLNQQIDLPPTPTPTPTLTPTPTSPWSLSPTLDTAAQTQVSMVRALLELVAWIVVVPGPYVLVIALAIWFFRRWKYRGKP